MKNMAIGVIGEGKRLSTLLEKYLEYIEEADEVKIELEDNIVKISKLNESIETK
jgi:hypothetical protein